MKRIPNQETIHTHAHTTMYIEIANTTPNGKQIRNNFEKHSFKGWSYSFVIIYEIRKGLAVNINQWTNNNDV